jgi:hypothetical protein
MIVTELDETWSVGFEKGVRVVYRPILFDLMRQTHEELAYHTRAWGVWTLLLFYEEFRDYHRSRVQKEMNLHDLPCPVWSHGFVRERPRLTIERTVEKSRGCPGAVRGQRAILPRFTWLVKVPAGEGWIQISLNIFRVMQNRHSNRDSVRN